jgi:manganese/zinc/iron transport system permease protein
LYGAIEMVPLDTAKVAMPFFGEIMVPRAAITLAWVVLLDIVVVVALYKELKITSFDPALATTLGINSRVMHYLLMSLVAITTVAAFEAVGSILVIAMLIVPAAAARLLTDRLGLMLVLSVVLASVSAYLGHISALVMPGWFGYEGAATSTAGMMAFVLGSIFLLVMLFAPAHGVVSKLVQRFRLSMRILRENILGLLWRVDEMRKAGKNVDPAEMLHKAFGVRPMTTKFALKQLRLSGAIELKDHHHVLTEEGREQAASLVRVHRLWEAYLEKYLNLKPDHLHPQADRLEHFTDPGLSKDLAEAVEGTSSDPHGKQIPPE